MYKDISDLILYGNLRGGVVMRMAEVIRDTFGVAGGDLVIPDDKKTDLVGRSFCLAGELIEFAVDKGLEGNLWQCLITDILMNEENAFTRTMERAGEPGSADNSLKCFALHDFEIIYRLFNYDFGPFESILGVTVLSGLRAFKNPDKNDKLCNREISGRIMSLCSALAKAGSAAGFLDEITSYYRSFGYGIFALNRAFRVEDGGPGGVRILPVARTDDITLDDLVGYEPQKEALRSNTEAFLRGRAANNVLLYGDAGTGKSTSVKALINEYFDRGLRVIEIHKHQLRCLSRVVSAVSARNYRFIVFIDDLSFEENEVEYKFLKSVIEGGVESTPDNVLIYATSNRRHLVRETWKDRDDMEHSGDVHRSDTMEEKTSLAARFGLSINYNAPTPKEYHQIVKKLAEKNGIRMSDEELRKTANTWEIRHGGYSGRAAQQLIQYLDSLE